MTKSTFWGFQKCGRVIAHRERQSSGYCSKGQKHFSFGFPVGLGAIPKGKWLKAVMPGAATVDNYLQSIYRDHTGEPTSNAKRLFITIKHPFVALAALGYISRFPVVKVRVSRSERSTARWLYSVRRPWRLNGFVLSYIELPSPLQHYWQGPSKQNLRTRTSQARAAGLTVRPVSGPEIRNVISQVFKDKGWKAREIDDDLRRAAHRKLSESLEDAICVGVFDPSDHVVGFCLGTQSGDAVRTLWSISSQKGAVRWLCFTGFVQEASARGARFIVEEPPWAFRGGNQIFAGHLGFVPARIRIA